MKSCFGEIFSGNAGIKRRAPPPPPPPPPAPSFSGTPKCKELERNKPFKENTNGHANTDEQAALLKYTYCLCNSRIISYYKPIHSIIQEGPSCGIAALSMASQLFQNVDAHVILTAAKQLNFSKSGEIFSVHNMATLASSLLDCDAIVINDLKSNKDSILSHICSGWPALIPYDADRNHEPCLNNGRSAHWAVVSGLCLAFPECCELEKGIQFETIQSGLKVHVADSGLLVKKLLKDASDVFVYAHQGKSRHLAVWGFDTLLQSNNNLYEVTNKYGIDELILPENDSLSELRDKAVLLNNRSV